MNSANDVLVAINELERNFPVGAWRAGDIDLWPTYRIRLFMNATLGILDDRPPPSALQRLSRLGARASRALWRVRVAGWLDRAKNARIQPGTTAAFLSDGVSFIRLGETWFDRVVDPVVLALEERGETTLKLTPHTEAHYPRWIPSRFVQPDIDRIKLMAWRHPVTVQLPEFDALHRRAHSDFGRHAPPRHWLLDQARRLEVLTSWYAGLLAASGSSSALLSNFYSLEGMAFVQAARRRGVPSVDLQHGLQGEHHGAYGRWAAVPDRGYSTLPDEFWVWTSAEAEAIDRWRGDRLRHRPKVVGNPWRDRWFNDSDVLVAQYMQRARELRGGHTRQALVSLSWGLADEETDKLIEAARRCDPSIGWWWRLHPVEAHRSDEFAARLAARGLDAEHVRAATDMPLYALIRAADLTLAHSSTVIQEAAAFGVPSIVTSDYGAQIHGALVANGTVLHATEPDSIAAAVATLASGPAAAPLSEAVPAVAGLPAALDALLARTRTALTTTGALP